MLLSAKVIHYCGKECQKSNFKLHKACCKKIHDLREQLSDENDISEDERKARQYDLAYAILTLGYKSTDTIERGKYIYDCALLEYVKLLRQDPFWIGACESVVLLLSILGYDGHCLTLIHFMLHPPPLELIERGLELELDEADRTSREARIRHYTMATSELGCDAWIYGPPGKKLKFSEYDKVRYMIPKCWGANAFLVPLMLISMRQSVGATLFTSPPSWKLMEETVEICRQVEYSADFILPVLRSLFPDSHQRWGEDEVCALLAHVDYRKLNSNRRGDDDDDDDEQSYKSNPWEQSCFTFWMMLKDCYAFTPGMLDVLERTISRMTELGINVIPEDPPGAPTSAEYTAFIKYMADRQRNGDL